MTLEWRLIERQRVLEFFYRTHDPTTLNQQGADTGTRMYFHHVLLVFFPPPI